MYERIIIADDGSPIARAASLPRAAAIAAAEDADVLVVRVSRSAGVAPDDLDEDDWDTCFEPEAIARATAEPLEAEPRLAGAVEDLQRRGVGRAASLVVHGDPGEALAEAADELEADLLVISSRGEGGLRRAVLGSVAEHLVRNARETPVLLCPAVTGDEEPSMRRVLLTLDGSGLSALAIPYAVRLARTLQADLTLLRAVEREEDLLVASMPVGAPPRPTISVEQAQQVAREARQAAEEDLRARAATIRERDGLDGLVTTEVVAGDPAHAILEATERLAADVVVMATHGRGGLGRLLLGSVADAVARESDRAAVLLVRPEEDD